MKNMLFTRVIFHIIFLMCFFFFQQGCKEETTREDKEIIITQLDIPPDVNQAGYSPADDSTVTVNPPPFTWLPVRKDITYPPDYVGYDGPREKIWVPVKEDYYYTLQISRNKNFKSGVITRKGIDISTYALDKSLEPGEWYWRYGVENGKTIYSKARRFIVPSDVRERPFPDIRQAINSVPKSRPRLFILSDELESFRRRALHGDLKETVSDIKSEIEKHIGEELPREPKYVKGIGPEFGEHSWRLIYDAILPPCELMETFGLVYFLTGEKKYCEEARRRVLHFLRMDPFGPTSDRAHNHLNYTIVEQGSRAYDWTYELFTPEEKEFVYEKMKKRITQLYDRLKYRTGREYHIYGGSHEESITNYIGQSAICFADEWDETEDWLKYVLTMHWNVYPVWGKEDGGSHQGPIYWPGGQNRVLHLIKILDKATGIDLMQKEFFQNTPYYMLYTNPPYARLSPFGDGHERPPDIRRGEVMYNYSSLLNDPYLRWYADYLSAGHGHNILGILLKNDDIKGRPPTDLPQSRYFPGVGLVSLHTDFGNAKEDIHFLFTSDPYGGVSHGHAVQNAFTIEAFGEALAISSGYYPWFGSDHHRYWTKQTKSSNNITIDGGKGQEGVAAAKGRIVSFESGDIFDYILGDATQAYMGLLNKFHRHVIHIRPGVFVMYDDLEAPEPGTFEWWLHALSEMSVDESGKSILISGGNARLRVNFLQSGKLNFDQFTGFPHPPEYRGETTPDYKDQWHVTASTVSKSTKAKFISILAPFKKDQEPNIIVAQLVEKSNEVSLDLNIDDKKYSVSFLPEVNVKKSTF